MPSIPPGSPPSEAAPPRTPGSEEMSKVHKSLMALATTHPRWFDQFETTDIETCHHEELFQLLRTAPTEFVRGYLAGTISMRVSIALSCGRPLF